MALSQTISYNGFTFEYTQLSVDDTPEWSEDGTYVLYHLLKFQVEGLIHAMTNLASIVADAEYKLSQPRGTLLIKQNGGWVWNIQPRTEHAATVDARANDSMVDVYDVASGPKPLDAPHIDKFTGGKAAHIRWTVECRVPGDTLPDQSGVGRGLLHFHAEETYAIDQDGYTTRTVSGSLTMASSDRLRGSVHSRVGTGSGYSADVARSYVLRRVFMPTNFQRESQNFVVSGDKRTLTFTIVDREHYRARPPFITSGDVRFGVNRANNLRIQFSLGGNLILPPSTKMLDVLKYIDTLIGERFPAVRADKMPEGGASLGRYGWIKAQSFEETFFERREVRFQYQTEMPLTWLVPGAQKDTAALAAKFHKFAAWGGTGGLGLGAQVAGVTGKGYPVDGRGFAGLGGPGAAGHIAPSYEKSDRDPDVNLLARGALTRPWSPILKEVRTFSTIEDSGKVFLAVKSPSESAKVIGQQTSWPSSRIIERGYMETMFPLGVPPKSRVCGTILSKKLKGPELFDLGVDIYGYRYTWEYIVQPDRAERQEKDVPALP